MTHVPNSIPKAEFWKMNSIGIRTQIGLRMEEVDSAAQWRPPIYIICAISCIFF